jgi:hypothetical protein
MLRSQNKNCEHGHWMAQINGGGKCVADCV